MADQDAHPVTLPLGGLSFEALVCGPDDGDLVLCLHGFPQNASAFSAVLPALGQAGLRAVSLTMRGFSAGSRTERVADYAVEVLADDALAAAQALGHRRFHLVGHDLGANVGWYLAATAPQRLRSLTAVSVPHPAAFATSMTRSPQPLRSSYVPFFQLPLVPEAVLGARSGWLLRRMLRRTGLEGATADAYVADLLPGNGLRAAFHHYRNLSVRTLTAVGAVEVPTTYVWSDGDTALDRDGALRTGAHVRGPYRLEVLQDVSHWIPEERPDELSRLVLDRVRASDGGSSG